MPSSRTHESVVRVRVAPPGLRLVQWPLREGLFSSCLLLIAEIVIAAVIGWSTGKVGAALISWVVLAAASWRLWLPVTYEFGPAGITETVLRRSVRIPWSAVANCEIRAAGVWLLPECDSTTIARTRGRFLRFQNHRRELLETLEYYLGSKLPLSLNEGSASTKNAHLNLPE